MFTGIIEEIGYVDEISDNRIKIKCNTVLKDTKKGDSIAVNGVCLTVKELLNDSFIADLSPQTEKVTALNKLRVNSPLNLERALCLSSRLGGHIVSGHIDTVGKMDSVLKTSDFYEIRFIFDKKFNKYIADKGSITVNGISLTVAEASNSCFMTAIIPHTFENTALQYLKQGDFVNIEFDILSKYVEKFLSSSDNNSITVDFLSENGFI